MGTHNGAPSKPRMEGHVMYFTRTAILFAALATAGLPLAASAQPQPAAVARTAEAVSIIEAVDQRERSVILRDEDG
jgi:hypothetical protein